MINSQWKVLISEEESLLFPEEITQKVLDKHVELLL